MRNLKKKGFTIVELVIVIAVIAVLAAVLIPTFSNLIKKANESSDIQLVRQMNTILKVEEPNSGKPANVDKVKEILAANGIVNPQPALATSVFTWDSEKNVIVLVDKETDKGVFPKEYEGVARQSTWEILSGTVNVVVNDESSLKDAIMNATLDQTVVLSSNLALSFIGEEKAPKNLNIDLGGHTLTLENGIPMEANSNISFSNGDVVSKVQVTLSTGSSVSLDNVNYTANGVAFYPLISAQVNINGGSVNAPVVIGTAYSNQKSRSIVVNISNAILGSQNSPCSIAIMMITSGDIEIEGCTIYANSAAVALRCGNINIKNTNINYSRTENYVESELIAYTGSDDYPNDMKTLSWASGSGNINAPIVIGDFFANHYSFDANCVLENVTIVKTNETYPDVYLSQEFTKTYNRSTGTYTDSDQNVKTTLICDNTIEWAVNPGAADLIGDYSYFTGYDGYYYSGSSGNTDLLKVDNIFVNGVEQEAGTTSSNFTRPANQVTHVYKAGESNSITNEQLYPVNTTISYELPNGVSLTPGDHNLSELNLNDPNVETYDYREVIRNAIKTYWGITISEDEFKTAELKFGSGANQLKEVKYTNAAGDLVHIVGLNIDSSKERLNTKDYGCDLGLTGLQPVSALVKTANILDTFKTYCMQNNYPITDNCKVIVENNVIVGIKY